MTKEQAIKHLKLMQSGARNAIRFKKNDKEISEEERKEDIEIYQDQLEALEIATKVLEQQPSEDCVSRQAVLETIEDCNSDGLKGIFCSYDDGERFKEYIKKLPPVTPTHCIAAVRFSKEELREICEERIEIAYQPLIEIEDTYKELRSMALRVKHNTGSIDTIIDRLDELLRGSENG